MEKKYLIPLFTILIIILYLSGCSQAPGCADILSSIFKYGGCHGKTIIRNYKINPKIKCLHTEVNNCEGGKLLILNKCLDDVKIGNVTINKKTYIELMKVNNKTVVNINGSTYIPFKNEFLSVDGYVGDQNFTISYIKTAKLCK